MKSSQIASIISIRPLNLNNYLVLLQFNLSFVGMDGDCESAPIQSWVDLLSQDDDDEDFVVKEKEKTDVRQIWTFEPKKDLPKKELSEIWSEESPPRFYRPLDRVDYASSSNRSFFDSNTGGLDYTMTLRAGKALTQT